MDAQAALFIRAWHDLGTCRQVGMGVGPIPWTAVMQWAQIEGLDDEAARLLWEVIVFLECRRVEREEAKRTLEKARGKDAV